MRYQDHLPLTAANLIRIVYMVGSAIVLQLYLKDLGASPFQISLLEVIFWGGNLLFAPLWGALSDASGRRKVFMSASMLLGGLFVPLFWFAKDIPTVWMLRMGFAAVAVGFPPVALAAMSETAEQASRGKSLAPYHTSRAVGFLLGWGGAGVVLGLLGFQYTFYALGLVGVVGFLVTLRIHDVDTPEEVTVQEVVEKAKERWFPSWDDASLRKDGLHFLLLGIFLRKSGLIGIFSLIAVYAVDVLGHSSTVLGLVLAMNPVVQLLFLDLFGTIADRHGRRNVLLLGFAASIGVPLLLIPAANPIVFGAAYALLGFAFAAMVQGSTAFIGDVAPDQRQGEFMGFRKSAQGLAGVVGPLLAGAIATVYSYRLMLLVVAALTALGFVTVWLGTDESLEDIEPHISLRQDLYDTFSWDPLH